MYSTYMYMDVMVYIWWDHIKVAFMGLLLRVFGSKK